MDSGYGYPEKGPRIVVIGGGTGSFTLLKGLKKYTSNLTALVNMADDGGSTGALRDELGVLPPGDVRQCLVALSNTPRMRELFNYRFDDGSLQGHAFGNLFLTALEKMTGSFVEAVEEASQILNIVGRVEPITFDKVTLVIDTPDGHVISGQFQISTTSFHGNNRPALRLEPKAIINPVARQAIVDAEVVVIAPGSLYGSLAPALIVDGVGDALLETRAKKVYVCNLTTKPGQTDGFTVVDYAAEIERFMGGAKLDYVLYNNVPPAPALLEKYAHEGGFPVAWSDEMFEGVSYLAKGQSLISEELRHEDSADAIASARSLFRHHSDRVARELMRIYFS